MYDVHWSARCLCAASMILGSLSVIKAAGLHQQIGILNSPLFIRLWLSRGRQEDYSLLVLSPFLPRFGLKSAKQPPPHNSPSKEPASEAKPSSKSEFEALPLQSSVSALKLVAMPRALLNVALLFFAVGFLLYVLLMWVEDVNSRPSDSRNTFIVLVIVISIYILCDGVLRAARALDQAKRHREFGNTRLGGFDQSERIAVLEAELRAARGEVQIDVASVRSPGSSLKQGTVSSMSAHSASSSR